ncbi:MAG: gliding motility-associated C-terminal domain-containing protein [Hymenobacter sp.]|nr:MAG: gliding motility-associated C-terminal domain-containing protein [Hymenobacter sp.]
MGNRPAWTSARLCQSPSPMASVTDSIRVGFYDCWDNLFVHNIITPNGDDRNDQLAIVGLGPSPWSLSIYNRWGHLVYTTDWHRQDWGARDIPAGLYYYLLQEPVAQRRARGWVEVVE